MLGNDLNRDSSMNDMKKMLQRQADWQKKRKELPWPEKIRMVEAIRESILGISRSGVRGEPTRAEPRATKK